MSAPLTLVTGTPGSGKTLWTIAHVKKRSESEGRPVYYSGIPGLVLPWFDLEDGFEVEGQTFKGAQHWFLVPPGALIVIDECQRLFRPRPAGSKVPDYVEALETLRHKGHDLYLITQHPMLVDTNIRRLVGRHVHISRRFGMHKATVLQFPSCRENPRQAAPDAERSLWSYPKDIFSLYKSAEVHTIKRHIPKPVLFGLLILMLLPFLAYSLYSRWDSRKQESTASKPDALPLPTKVSHSQKDSPASPEEFIASLTPRIHGLPYTAPYYDEVTKPVDAPYPAGCYKMKDRCRCFTQQGTLIAMRKQTCEEILRSGGVFLAWKSEEQLYTKQSSREAPAPAPEQSGHDVSVIPDSSKPLEWASDKTSVPDSSGSPARVVRPDPAIAFPNPRS